MKSVSSSSKNRATRQTVTGTLANPFGSVDVANLGSALASMNATAYFEADASALGAETVSARLGGNATEIWGSGAIFDALGSSVTAFGLNWDLNGNLTFAKMLNNGNVIDISTFASIIPTTTTIMWHPLS